MSSAHTKTRARGAAFQARCAKLLEAEGWTVHDQRPVAKAIPKGPGKFIWVSSRNDIFGALDLIAVRPGARVRGVQVTLDSGLGRKLKDIAAIGWPLDHMDIEVWLGASGGEIRIVRYDGAGFSEIGRYMRGKFYRREEAAKA